jgi:hypothetical protein
MYPLEFKWAAGPVDTVVAVKGRKGRSDFRRMSDRIHLLAMNESKNRRSHVLFETFLLQDARAFGGLPILGG